MPSKTGRFIKLRAEIEVFYSVAYLYFTNKLLKAADKQKLVFSVNLVNFIRNGDFIVEAVSESFLLFPPALSAICDCDSNF